MCRKLQNDDTMNSYDYTLEKNVMLKVHNAQY